MISTDELREMGDDCLCLAVQRASRRIGRKFDDALRPLKLTNWQMTTLATIAGLDQPAISDVANHLAMDQTTVSATLKPLERRGLVERVQDAHDRRSRRLRLTQQGEDLLTEAFYLWRSTNAAVAQVLPPENADDVRLALRRLAMHV